MGRKNHYWEPGTNDCRHCGLLQGHVWCIGDKGQVLDVIVWTTPTGRTVRIRPTFARNAPSVDQTAGTIEDLFEGIEIGGVPECPKSPDAWTSA